MDSRRYRSRKIPAWGICQFRDEMLRKRLLLTLLWVDIRNRTRPVICWLVILESAAAAAAGKISDAECLLPARHPCLVRQLLLSEATA